jgi:hypothetical protein
MLTDYACVRWRSIYYNIALNGSEMNQLSFLAENPNLHHELLRFTTNHSECCKGSNDRGDSILDEKAL